MSNTSSPRSGSSRVARTTKARRRAWTLGVLACAAWVVGCGDSSNGKGPEITPPPTPPVTPVTPPVAVVDSTAPATLQVQDTVRFSGLFQRRVPAVRLLDLRGQVLPTSAITWRSEAETTVLVARDGFALISQSSGATRVIATVMRANGAPLVDTVHAVVTPVVAAIVLERRYESLLIGEEAALRVQGRDSAGTLRDLPDSLRTRVTWRSQSPQVATVDATSRLRGIAQGATVVEVSLPSLGLRDTVTFAVSRRYDLPNAHVFSATITGFGMEEFAMNPDGSALYIIESGARARRTLSALAPDGTLRWQYPLGPVARQLSVGGDGTVYFQDGSLLRAYGREGQELYPAGLPCGASAPNYAVDSGGVVYCARPDSLVAYARDGAVLWSQAVIGAQAVVVGGQDRVYAYGRGITAFTRAGTKRWERDAGGALLTVGAVDAEGALYFTRLDGSLGAVGPDGQLRWQVPDVRGTLAIAPGGTLIIAESGGRRMVSALRTADGVGRWRVFNEAMLSGGRPHVGDDDRLYVASACDVHVFDVRSGDVLGRTAGRLCSGTGTSFIVGRLFLADNRNIEVLTLPTRPGSEWSQLWGNAGHTRGPEPR